MKPSGFPAQVAARSCAEEGISIWYNELSSSGMGSEYITIISKQTQKINSFIKTAYEEAGFPP